MFLQLTVSAPTESEAKIICDELLTQQLIAGARMTPGDTRYWWNDKINARIYWNINAFTISEHKEKIIAAVKKLSSDETPIIALVTIDGSQDFLNWISENTLGHPR